MHCFFYFFYTVTLMARTVALPARKTAKGKVGGKVTKEAPVARKRTMSVTPPVIKTLPRKPKKIKRRTNILKEIRFFQQNTNFLIPRALFLRLLKSVVAQNNLSNPSSPSKFTKSCVEALQEVTEAYIISLIESSYLCTIHAKRVTLYASDINLAKKLRKRVGAV
ncbi:histone H3 protein [Spraguea lophii 42_110]|uniref:Histone H3 protein n=1 Tax=Spraguea lophii (strain 42_110) TaxID=1358809 RepID=S7XL01_SPRLO|nr:histone H3 protein [Spraguea lophii 42_110]